MTNIIHPYGNLSGGKWLRGNLHTHTTASDGARDLATVIADYRERGYDFLVISDHDIYTGPAELLPFAGKGLTLIPGNEITAHGVHMLHVGATGLIEPHPDRQKVIDEATNRDAFIVVNHPNWEAGFDHCPIRQLETWQGYGGLEIYNGVVSRLMGSSYATMKWDTLLSRGRRVWGFANDDSHRAEDVELGWNVVYAQDADAQSIVSALRAGRFYASTGVTINTIEVEGDRIRIEAADAQRIVASGIWGHRLATADGPVLEIEIPSPMPYVRFECWGSGERFAWTQPFWAGDAPVTK